MKKLKYILLMKYDSIKLSLKGRDTSADACQGDSGGAVVVEGPLYGLQLGIVSYGPYPCGSENIPAVFTSVAYYRDWILSQLRP